jgi:glucokinase
MAIIGIDLGGTKLALAVFSEAGEVLWLESVPMGQRKGAEVGALIRERLAALPAGEAEPRAVGVAVPGIYRADRGTVWAPNLPGWDDYPLRDELRAALGPGVPVCVDSDRAAYVLGESWQGTARGARNVVFVAVGTGIGAGVLVDGRVLRGQRDIAGAIGWLALDRPYRDGYPEYGCFEHQASGPGLTRYAAELLRRSPEYRGRFHGAGAAPTPAALFDAYDSGDEVAVRTLDNAVSLWGMATANLVSLLDPEVVVFGGGIFGPATRFLGRIRDEALRWGQPISTPQVRLAASSLGGDAGLYGAARLALEALAGAEGRPLPTV